MRGGGGGRRAVGSSGGRGGRQPLPPLNRGGRGGGRHGDDLQDDNSVYSGVTEGEDDRPLSKDDPGFAEELALRRRRHLLQQLISAIRHNRSLFGTKLDDARKMFTAMDRDNSGVVSKDEFEAALHRLDINLDRDTVDEMLRVLTSGGGGGDEAEGGGGGAGGG